ncbi:MAG: PP0621 family protein [Pseudomonadota bacterium]
MSRILFWVALFILVAFAVRTKLRSMAPKNEAKRPPAPLGPDGEAMACCAHCHVYFPSSEAVQAGGLQYCSPAHVRLPPQ